MAKEFERIVIEDGKITLEKDWYYGDEEEDLCLSLDEILDNDEEEPVYIMYTEEQCTEGREEYSVEFISEEMVGEHPISKDELLMILSCNKVKEAIQYTKENGGAIVWVILTRYVKERDVNETEITEENVGSIIMTYLVQYIDIDEESVEVEKIYDDVIIPDCIDILGRGIFNCLDIEGKIKANNLISIDDTFDDYAGTKLDLTELNISKLMQMYMTFENADVLEVIDFGNQKAENLRSVECMFFNCPNLKKLNIQGFKLDKKMDCIVDGLDSDELEIKVGKEYEQGVLENINKVNREENEYNIVIKDEDIEKKINRAKALSGIDKTIIIEVC